MLSRHLSMEKKALSRSPGDALLPELRASTSSLANLLVSDNQLSFRFRDCFGERSEAVGEFLELIANLREIVIANINRIMSSKPSSNNLLEDAINKEHKENISSKHLKEKIETRRKLTSEILNNKRKYVESLKRQIAVVQGKCEEVRSKIRLNDRICHQESAPSHEQAKQQLLAELDAKRVLFISQKEANRGLEEKLHRRKVSSESEIQKTINSYDTTMMQIFGEVNDLRNDLEVKKERIRLLTNHFQKLDEARAAQVEQERLEMIRKTRLNRNLRLWVIASILLQRHIRLVNRIYGKKKGKRGGKKKK